MGSGRRHRAVWSHIQAALMVPSQPQHPEGCNRRRQQGFPWLPPSEEQLLGVNRSQGQSLPAKTQERSMTGLAPSRFFTRTAINPPATTIQKEYTARAPFPTFPSGAARMHPAAGFIPGSNNIQSRTLNLSIKPMMQ